MDEQVVIDSSKLSAEVISKYTLENNALKMDVVKNPEKDLYTNDPKDEINVIIGDDKQPDTFLPQVKLERWSNEVNFSVRLKESPLDLSATASTDKDKIKYSKGNVEIDFYDYMDDEGGYKLVWYLKEKPLTNKVEFTIQSKGLDFFYQPELTPEEIARGMKRPENVVGSYAVYHSTKGGMNDKDGKEYKVGKAFHIYRPHIIDAEGKETWGILHIENGIYSVEIPQEFLDTAVYPIKSNDTFGYDTGGGSGFAFCTKRQDISLYYSTYRGQKFASGGAGTLDSITCYEYSSSTFTVTTSVFVNEYESGGAGNHGEIATKEGDVSLTTTKAWKTYTLASESINSDDYCLGICGDPTDLPNAGSSYNWGFITYDASSSKVNMYDDFTGTGAYASCIAEDPRIPGATATDKNFSIYATYTAAAGATYGEVSTVTKRLLTGVGL